MRGYGAAAALSLLLGAVGAGATRLPAPGGSGEDAPRDRQELPAGVTRETVAEGREVYLGPGLCYVCHGRRGDGVERAGSSLRDTAWYHTDGSYESIVDRVRRGISARASATSIPMPPRGGSEITDAQVRAAAAYVWWLSRGGNPGGPPGSG